MLQYDRSMRCVMKFTRLFFLAFLLMGYSALAYADGVPVDPQMDVSDPACTTASCPNPAGFGLGFQFTVNTEGGGIFMATNQSATTDSNGQWNSLLFTFMSPTVGVDSVSCTSGAGGNAPFGSPCTKSTEENGTVDLLYTVVCAATEICTSGIPNNDIFTINLNAIIPGDTWPAGLTFNAYPNANKNVSGFVILTETPMPEPGTITLLGAGLAALVAKRRFRSQRQARS